MGGIYWIASYPKSGNTWFRAFLQNFLEDGEQPVNINNLSTGSIASSRNWLDEVLGFDTADLDFDETDRLRPDVYKWSLNDTDIGYHKIHDAYISTVDNEPLICPESTLGALYIIRNPFDVALSYANHNLCSIDDAIKLLGKSDHALCRSQNKMFRQTRQKLLNWSNHVLSWINAREINCQVIRYEDMLTRPFETFSKAIQFLGLPEDFSRIEKSIRFSDFSVLRSQEEAAIFEEKPPKVEFFFRRGKIGEWKDKLTSDQKQLIIDNHGDVMHRFGYLDICT